MPDAPARDAALFGGLDAAGRAAVTTVLRRLGEESAGIEPAREPGRDRPAIGRTIGDGARRAVRRGRHRR